MAHVDRHIQEAVRESFPSPHDASPQLSLGLFPCLVESLGFLQVCCLADIARRVISHQFRMYYREEFDLWYGSIEAFLHARQIPHTIRLFLADPRWANDPLQVDRFWFPNMKELVFLTYIVEERGLPVWTKDRCEAFYCRAYRRSGARSPHLAATRPSIHAPSSMLPRSVPVV
jgi:hypothetical protein